MRISSDALRREMNIARRLPRAQGISGTSVLAASVTDLMKRAFVMVCPLLNLVGLIAR